MRGALRAGALSCGALSRGALSCGALLSSALLGVCVMTPRAASAQEARPAPAPTIFSRKTGPQRTLVTPAGARADTGKAAPAIARADTGKVAPASAPAAPGATKGPRLTYVAVPKFFVPPLRPLAVRPLARSFGAASRLATAAPLLARRGKAGAPSAVVAAKAAPAAPAASLTSASVATPASATNQVRNLTPNLTPNAAPNPAPSLAQSAPASKPATNQVRNLTPNLTPIPSPSPSPNPPAPATTTAARTQTPPPAAQQPRAGWAHVTYISGSSIYIDAGTRAGLKEGSQLDVMRGNNIVAQITVAYVSSTRASCTVLNAASPVQVGDSARFTPVQSVVAQAAREAAPADSAKARQLARSGARGRSAPIRGRLGIRYLSMRQDAGASSLALSQPGVDVRLDGRNIGGSPFGLTVDIRAYRQNYGQSGRNSPSSTTRAYQTALIFNPANSGTRVQLGRQFSSALSPVGLFDGVALDLDKRHFSVGGFSGSQPDPRTFGYSGDVREHGAYVQMHNAPNAPATWTMTAGGIGSYAGGQIDREFAYLQGMFNNKYLSLYTAQEVDVNRGWKAAQESSSATPTSTFAMLRVSPNNALTFFGGYDNRRSIRLYRDFLTPEINFDDSFRQGAWGGASLYVLGHLRLDGDARTSRGGAAGVADSYTGSLHVTRITPLQLGFQLRTTRYSGERASGDLSAASIEMQPVGNFRFEINGGRRGDRFRNTAVENDVSSNTSTTWVGADADLGIGRSLYLMASTYRESGAFQKNMQMMLALTYRF